MGRTRKAELTDRLKGIAKVATQLQSWRPAAEVLTKVRAHPTCFPLLDRATRVGGWPIERICLVHGPSNHGKTALTHGLGLSFLQAANFYAFVDAEYATPQEWLRDLMRGFADHPGFIAKRPDSYEQTVESVREVAETVAKGRDAGDLHPDTTALIVVDSIRKLVPRNLMKKILKGKDGLDGASGRGAMIKAALNAQWLDELVPLLYHTHCGLVFVSREYESQPDLSKLNDGDPTMGFDYKVGGGRALIFESSIVARVTRTFVTEGSGEASRVVGEKHRVTIRKTKVGGKDDRVSIGYFHTSNGVLVPAGFDRARDVFEMCRETGIIDQAGAWFSYQGERLGQGASNAVKTLTENSALMNELEAKGRAA